MSLHDMGLGRYKLYVKGICLILSAVLILRGIEWYGEAFDLLEQTAATTREALKEEYIMKNCGALLAGLKNLDEARSVLEREDRFTPSQLEQSFRAATWRLDTWGARSSDDCWAKTFRGYRIVLKREGEGENGVNWVYGLGGSTR
jgi:hypothetical protein